jgi:hypothetical protein
MDTLFGTTESSGAAISDCGLYRYVLWRKWGDGPTCLFVMLNPSVADATQDDPTIRRCVGFAKREGCGKLAVVNLFAYRATKPADMLAAADPVGPDNDRHLAEEAATAKVIIAAWGDHGTHRGRDRQVMKLLAGREVWCLRRTKGGQPGHPLYVPAAQPLERFFNGSRAW